MINPSEYFCSQCGTRLVFVCAKCFRILDSPSPKGKLCADCAAAEIEKKKQRKQDIKDMKQDIKDMKDVTLDLAGVIIDRKIEETAGPVVGFGIDVIKEAVFKKGE